VAVFAGTRKLTIVLPLDLRTYACCVRSLYLLCQQQQRAPVQPVSNDVAASSSAIDIEVQVKHMLSAALLLEFTAWLQAAKGTSVTLKQVSASLVKWECYFAQHNYHSRVAVVKFVRSELLSLMHAQHIKFNDDVHHSQLILEEWHNRVTACSDSARETLQQVRRLICSCNHLAS
jgi:hypothetical protein